MIITNLGSLKRFWVKYNCYKLYMQPTELFHETDRNIFIYWSIFLELSYQTKQKKLL